MDVAVLGCGAQGQHHIEALQRVPGFSVRAICDVDPLSVERLQSLYSVPYGFSDYRELLAKQHVDLAVVCTMPDSHRDIVVAALAAGAHVFCEKPFALDRHQAAEMVGAAQRAGKALVAGFNLRYCEVSQWAKSAIGAGQIGTPVYARARSRSDIPRRGSHHVSAISGGGVLAGSAVHVIDLACWVAAQARPVRASAFLTRELPELELVQAGAVRPEGWDCDSSAFGVVRFEGGFSILIDAEWAAGTGSIRHEVEVVGDRARITLVPFDSAGPPAVGPGPGGAGEGPPPEHDLAGSVEREWAALAEAFRSGNGPTGEDAFVVQAVIDALYESAACAKEVAVDLSALSGTSSPVPGGGSPRNYSSTITSEANNE